MRGWGLQRYLTWWWLVAADFNLHAQGFYPRLSLAELEQRLTIKTSCSARFTSSATYSNYQEICFSYFESLMFSKFYVSASKLMP
jgi:hypothetical protein